MIAGAYSAVLEIGLWESYLLSVIPVFLFTLFCLKASSAQQINVAAIMSSVYAIVMLMVTIGTIINLATSEISSPDVLFLVSLVAIFMFAGFLHPNELMCLVHGLLYYITVPSTFVFLTVFFLCNLNIVTWGTREGGPKKEEPAADQSQAPPQEKGKLQKFFEKLGLAAIAKDIASFAREMIGIRQEMQQQQNSQEGKDPGKDKVPSASPSQSQKPPVPAAPKPEAQPVVEPDPTYWTRELDIPGSKVGSLAEREVDFWKFLIAEYLYPMKADKGKQEEIKAELLSARNNVVFAFMLLNLMFTLVLLQLRLKTDDLKDTFFIAGKYEPVSTVSLAVFSMLLLTQFLGMLGHRWGTFLHLIATTKFSCCSRDDAKEQAMVAIQEAQKITSAPTEAELQLMEPDYPEDDDEEDTATISTTITPRASIHDLTTIGEEHEPDYSDNEEETGFGGSPDHVQYDRVFDRRFTSLQRQFSRQSEREHRPHHQHSRFSAARPAARLGHSGRSIHHRMGGKREKLWKGTVRGMSPYDPRFNGVHHV